MASVKVLLRGGPFDGDQGILNGWSASQPPARIFAWACPDPRCGQGGVHWAVTASDANFEAEIYEHEDREKGIDIYVWRDIGADLDHFIHETVEEPLLV